MALRDIGPRTPFNTLGTAPGELSVTGATVTVAPFQVVGASDVPAVESRPLKVSPGCRVSRKPSTSSPVTVTSADAQCCCAAEDTEKPPPGLDVTPPARARMRYRPGAMFEMVNSPRAFGCVDLAAMLAAIGMAGPTCSGVIVAPVAG